MDGIHSALPETPVTWRDMKSFGPRYESYCREVPRWIPRIPRPDGRR